MAILAIFQCLSGEEVMSKVSKDDAAGIYKKLVFTPDGTKLLGGILVGATWQTFSTKENGEILVSDS